MCTSSRGRCWARARPSVRRYCQPKEPLPLRGRLYRNDLQIGADGVRTLRFTDVTEQSGLDARGYGMGVAAGDYDNDGCVDLYLTNFGPNQLFRNNCDGTFTDVSRTSGVAGDGWSVPAAFVDFDRDGWLDLFVGHYLAYSVDRNVNCFTDSRLPDYCPPERYRAEPDRLYRNLRNGTFADVTASSGVARAFGPALGVATADFNGDKWIDIFVANDQKENQLWINQRDGTFKDMALRSGAALSATGSATANMGVDAGDFDNDGDEDLIVTELNGQGSALYVNDGTGLFEEQSARTGIRLMTLPYTGFGAGWFDYDNDGWLDILAVNGLVTQNLDKLGPDNPFPLQQPNLLIRNLGNGEVRGCHATRRCRVPAVGSEPRRRVRRHRQRRRRGRGRDQRCRPGPLAAEPDRQPAALAGTAPGRGGRPARHARAHASPSFVPRAPRCGDGRERTAATRLRTIPAW